MQARTTPNIEKELPRQDYSSKKQDALSNILKAIRLQASSYFCTEFSAPWGIRELQTDYGTFHYVVTGGAWLSTEDNQHDTYLSCGDIVAFPTGSAHQISDAPNSKTVSGDELLAKIYNNANPFEGEFNKTTLLCGYFKYQSHSNLPILRDMPSFVHIQQGRNDSCVWLNSLANILARESRSALPGGTVVVDRLTEAFVIQILRWHINTQDTDKNYFSALGDTRLSCALSIIHRDPAHPWTVERLARQSGMSRSAFSSLFHEVIGMTPMAYLSQWRMHLAQDLLRDKQTSMVSIAEQVGYRSESSFSKAFKKIVGVSPGQIRRSQ
ncbi:AraC family transcriptional regulator [Pseudoalteromonas sp. SMS1]|uniref:AraC family transcriptional regulator n=1 Tax=Pseudoalteromonas sp. SMS1 TaxID=2908894 RepID=UPI001F3FFDC4|nr:AraC family transcriptional regulator [Pseudoalteromonas sp. SMS1]MCF2858135.1 AraC family transcriptional regulator [Pseudoalteromonas sp. SMS1]